MICKLVVGLYKLGAQGSLKQVGFWIGCISHWNFKLTSQAPRLLEVDGSWLCGVWTKREPKYRPVWTLDVDREKVWLFRGKCAWYLTHCGWVHDFCKGRTQCRELPLCAGSREGCQWQALPLPVQCEETATRTRDLPVIGGKTLPLAPGPPFKGTAV